MLQRAYPGQVCSIARALEVVGERWTLLILRDAVLGLERFDEFQQSLGIATNVLASRLRLLCEEGVMERVPPKYVLTDKGREVAPALVILMKWGDRHYPMPEGPPRLTLHAGCGGAVGADLRCERCARHVEFDELELHPGPALAAAQD